MAIVRRLLNLFRRSASSYGIGEAGRKAGREAGQGIDAEIDAELGETEAALQSLECSALEREGRAVRVALAEAERSGDEARIVQLVARKQQVERAIRAL